MHDSMFGYSLEVVKNYVNIKNLCIYCSNFFRFSFNFWFVVK